MATTKRTFKSWTANGSKVYVDHNLEHLRENDLEVWLIDSTSGYGDGKAVLQIKDQDGGTLGNSHSQVTNIRVPTLANSVNQRGWEYTSASRVTLKSTPPSGSTIIVQRNTGRGGSGNAYQSFAAGSTIRANDLNKALDEVRFRAEESINGTYGGSVGAEADTPYLEASLLKGTSAAINGNAITNLNAGNLTGTLGATSGANLTNLNATQLTSGTVPDARFPSTLPAASGENLTNLPGANLTGNISADRLPNASVGQQGIVELSDATNNNSTNTAATTNRIKVLTDTLTADYYTNTQLNAGQLDNRYYTETEADARFYNLASTEEIQSGETWVAADNKVATTSAIDARITDLVDDVGGFVPIANETSFPSANPDVNNGAGTLVSIKALASALTSNGSGVATIANAAGSGNTVTINGLANSTTYAAGIGILVETTTTLHTYTFHRQVPDATSTTTVAGSITNVNTVATNISNVNAVAGNNTNINTVAGNNSNINTVAGANANIGTVATNISDVNNFADLYQISNSAPSTDGGGNALANGDLWFDSSSNKQLKVHNGTAFTAVSPTQAVLDDIAIVSGNLTRQEDLGNVSDALASPTTTSSLTTCADNITDINTFANVYRIAASAPNSSLDEGDLWYDSTINVLKYYTGSAWTVTAGAGLSALADDSSPELAANLDCNNKNLTEVGTVSGDNLQIDFGTIA